LGKVFTLSVGTNNASLSSLKQGVAAALEGAKKLARKEIKKNEKKYIEGHTCF